MRHIFIGLIFLSISVFHCSAQWNFDGKRGSKWYFSSSGRLNILDFSQANTTQLPLVDSTVNQNMHAFANRAFISDTSGNLLFYSNGSIIYDKTLQPMLNGDSITPNYINSTLCFVDGVIILPMPKHDSIYYVFTVTSDTPCSKIEAQYIYYSIVNMKENAGKGAVISKSNLMFIGDSLATAHLKACRHGNGRDWWLLLKDFQGNSFYRFLLDSSGVHLFSPQVIGSSFVLGNAWQSTFSPNGDKFAIASGHGTYDHDTSSLNIYDFDRCTGLLSNAIQFPIWRTNGMSTPLSICFSPNSKYLYWCRYDSLFQYDIQSGQNLIVALFDTSLVPPHWDSLGLTSQFSFSYMQLGPDNRIYIGTLFNMLHYINRPDSAGTACDVHQLAIQLPSFCDVFLFSNPFFSIPPICYPDALGEEKIQVNNVVIYPNPSNGNFIVETSKPNSSLEVYSILGKFILSGSSTTCNINVCLNHLTDGVYLLKIITADKNIIWRKIVIE